MKRRLAESASPSPFGSDAAAGWLVVKTPAGEWHRVPVFVRGHRMYAAVVSGADLDAVNGA